MRPTHGTEAGRTYLALQKLATAQSRPTDELLQLYVLERFLARLAISEDASCFVLKGGVLLAAFDSRRPTRDVDLAARNQSNELDDVVVAMKKVVTIEIDDGVMFDVDSLSAESIREDSSYTGARVAVHALISRAKLVFHIDVNFGDPIIPAPQIVHLPSLLGRNVELLGYPIGMVIAEKLVTAVHRGTTSTRWRDFADLWSLTRRHDVDGSTLDRSVQHVARHRQVELRPLSVALEGYADVAQSQWTAWRSKVRLHDYIPESFAEVLSHVVRFGDPVVEGQAQTMMWIAASEAWSHH